MSEPQCQPEERATRLREYFTRAPRRPRLARRLCLLGGGGLLLLVGLSLVSTDGGAEEGCSRAASAIFLVPGLLLTVWQGIAIAIRQWRYRQQLRAAESHATDAQVQEWLEKGLEQSREHALASLGLEPADLVSEPFLISSPVLWRVAGVSPEDLVCRRGTDGVVRFGVYRIAVIALTERLVTACSCDYNFLRDQRVNTTTQEHQWRDIVAVSTEKQPSSLVLPNGEHLKHCLELRVAVANGDGIRVIVNAPELNRITGFDTLPANGADRAVRVIRAMLRERHA